MNVDFSVIVPCYNGAKYIDECMTAIVSQHAECNWEIVFVDDASTDDSVVLVESWYTKLPDSVGLVLKKNAVNQGLPLTRKSGLAAASGDYIIFCDVDDVISTDFIASAFKAFSSAEIDMLVTPVHRFKGVPNFNLMPFDLTVRTSSEAMDEFQSNHFGGGWVWNKVWRKDLIVSAFGRLSDLGRFDVDYELTTLGYALSENVGSAAGLCYGYRITPGSMVNSTKSLGFGFAEHLNNYSNLCLSGLSHSDLEKARPVFLNRILWSYPNSGSIVPMAEDNEKVAEKAMAVIQEADPKFLQDLQLSQHLLLVEAQRWVLANASVRLHVKFIFTKLIAKFR